MHECHLNNPISASIHLLIDLRHERRSSGIIIIFDYFRFRIDRSSSFVVLIAHHVMITNILRMKLFVKRVKRDGGPMLKKLVNQI
jgi:hypothetical protein